MPYDFRGDPILSHALEYWRAKRGGRLMPCRRDIDPTEIPRLLPNIQITEMVDGGPRIRYRLCGTAIVAAYGAELAGKYIDEIFSGERLRFIEENYRNMCAERRPMLVCNRYFSKRDAPLICNRLVMPLSEDGESVSQLFTAMRFQFPGEAHQWAGHWFGNNGNFDFSQSYAEFVD